MLSTASCITLFQDGEWATVYTPNGTSVSVYDYYDNYELNMFVKNELKELMQNIYPDAIYLSEATKRYNCHSYAWHNQNTFSNEYWMNDPSAYYTDGSYVETQTPQVGDIIFYFFSNNTSTVDDDVNLHSGIVVGIEQGISNGICGIANLVTVESKWGAYPLFRHRGDLCPYIESDAIMEYFPNEVYADYIKFYRRHVTHEYNHNYVNNDRETHYSFCICGSYVLQAHNFDVDSKCIFCNFSLHSYEYTFHDNNRHKITCIHCDSVDYAGHVFTTQDRQFCIVCKSSVKPGTIGEIIMPLQYLLVSANGSYVMQNGCIVLVPQDIENYFNGTLLFYNPSQENEIM